MLPPPHIHLLTCHLTHLKEGIPPWARDAYATGKLISAFIAQFVETENRSPAATLFPWFELQMAADRLATPSPLDRIRVEDALSSPFFTNNVLINVVERFLKDIRAVDPDEKRERFQCVMLYGCGKRFLTHKHCFRQLPHEIRSLPSATVGRYVLPLLLNRDLLSESGVETLYESLLVPRYGSLTKCRKEGILPTDLYDERILPFIDEMLRVRTYNVRLVMLQLFHG